MIAEGDDEKITDISGQLSALQIIDDRLAYATDEFSNIEGSVSIVSLSSADDGSSSSTSSSSTSLQTPAKANNNHTNSNSSPTSLFVTPSSSKHSCCTDSTCSVCLSPLLIGASLVETRCRHTFHEKCLKEAKGIKSQCPNCRADLTPLQPLLQESQDEPPVVDNSMGFRNQIRARSAAIRETQRLASVRREYERQMALEEAQNSNKENQRS